MRPAHELERAVGMSVYVSDAEGVGGHLRERPADFRVRELELFPAEPVGTDPGSYPHLVLRVRLVGWDTNDFAGTLADRLGISRERISWAGTKDKHAVTTQLFTVQGVDPGDLPSIEAAEVEVVGRAGRPILFGDLVGNEFEVVVRDVERPEAVDAVTEDLQAFAAVENGDGAGATVAVPNFFGQQRFGSRRPVTHEVGLAILRADWEGAVMAYAGNPHEREPTRTREARALVEETRDWRRALDDYPTHLGYERAMLHRLDERVGDGEGEPADFRAALEAVPTNLQRLFVNAAQSYVFNRILSERLDRGLPLTEPVEGDVVCFSDREGSADLPLPDASRTQRVTAERVHAVTRHCERDRAFVTAPLVGTDTEFAEGEPGEVERSVCEDVGVEPGAFDLPGEFESTGTRRAVLVRTELVAERDPLSLSFTLPRGAYATVLLREYLKVDPEDL